MLDVMLVLLVIFMVAVPLSQHVIPTQLPQESAGPAGPDVPLVLAVGRGRYTLNQQPMSPPALRERLRAYAGRTSLLVEGEAGASYQDVVTAMDIARGAGVRVIGLAPKRVATRPAASRDR